MKKVVQNIRNGRLSVEDTTPPAVGKGQVLISNRASLISAGTEKMIMDLAKKSLAGKAAERPDHVKRVLEKIANEGLASTIEQVMKKLDEPMSMGYSSAGVVLACGEGVQEFKPGDRVASNGSHAGVVSIPKHLCARIPDSVPFDQAAFTVLGAIALQGVRLADVQLGGNAFVVGLGLVGQITVALLKAQGCLVLGTDPDEAKCKLALELGADAAAPDMTADEVAKRTRGLGADAVIIAASTPSNAPVQLAAEAVRQKGRVVAVGLVGLDLPRRPFYFKEAEVVVSCSYGPGRYDPFYEEQGHDYPAAHVRWTEQRNMQAVLDLMGQGRLDLARLISHRFPIDDALKAYEMIAEGSSPYLGIVLEYPDRDPAAERPVIELGTKERTPGRLGFGCLGAGNFAKAVLLPAIAKETDMIPRIICSAGGLSATTTGRDLGFEAACSDEGEVFGHSGVDAVFVITRHDQHARQVIAAIEAGKHVFVEKPLALTVEELDAIEKALAAAGPRAPHLMVGFNRRFSPAAWKVRNFFADETAPLTIAIRFNAGEIPADHWTQDDGIGGGRIVGEACHAIDLATYLAGSPPVRVFAESVGGAKAPRITDDQCFITVRHANGSVSNVAYLSGGDKSLPKERVEVFGGGGIAVIDDFRRVTLIRHGRKEEKPFPGQDKGHRAEVAMFARSLVDGGPAPIPWSDLRAVSLASILAVRSIREGVPFDVR